MDAKSQTTTFDFDELGRMVHRLKADLEGYWVYDTATAGVGKLAEACAWAAGAKDYRRIHTCDSLVTPGDDDGEPVDWDYSSEYGYD